MPLSPPTHLVQVTSRHVTSPGCPYGLIEQEPTRTALCSADGAGYHEGVHYVPVLVLWVGVIVQSLEVLEEGLGGERIAALIQ
jgi:hypothetical protein